MTKAIQQIMLGTVTKNEKQAAESLKRIKAAGYDGIELNGFMIKPTSFLVRMLTKAHDAADDISQPFKTGR